MKIVKDEKEIFDLLGFPYLKPEERDYAIWRPKYEAAGESFVYSYSPLSTFADQYPEPPRLLARRRRVVHS